MVTLNGVLRSYGAAIRRAEREQQRQARESAKRFKEQRKFEEIANAEQAVSDWLNYVEMLQSVHKVSTEPINWDLIKASVKPSMPNQSSANEDMARDRLNSYKPSLLDKVFRSIRHKFNEFERLIEQAKAKDQKEYDLRYKEYLEELDRWAELQEISSGVKRKEVEFYKRALDYFDPFSDMGELGVRLCFNFNSNHIDIDMYVNSSDVIPDYELKQTSTGRLSKKAMAKMKFNELYQDHICSSTLRVSREVFSYLPIDYARVNAIAKILNKSTGHMEEQPILSVTFLPKTIQGLNLDLIDPSESMRNFLHNMNFSKTNGFDVVAKVEFVS
jgi:hypothetical protein